MPVTIANPGNLVVPLSTIIDQLKGKLSSDDIDNLLAAIVAKKKTEVRPGDLITADLINQVLSDISDLELRVAQLESNQGSVANQVILTQPNNGDNFRVGDALVIQGKNLGFSTGTSVITFSGQLATDVNSTSTDNRITVKIPDIPSLDPSGSSVLLVVSNGFSSAQRVIVVRPAQDLAGAIDVSWSDVSPNPFSPGGSATFGFKLNSRANMNATFQVTPLISRVANASTWNGALKVLPATRVLVPAGGSTSIQVQVNPVPAVAVGTTFALSVAATAGSVAGTTGRLRLAVGTAVQLPDPSFSLAVDAINFSPAGSGSF